MAFASIISSAIGIILLIVTAYVLVGGVLTTTQVAMNAQSEMTAVHMKMLGTGMAIDSTYVENSSPNIIYLNIRNSGSEPIDLTEFNVFLQVPESAPVLIPKGTDVGKWSVSPDVIQWRPAEELNLSVRYAGGYPVIVRLTTGNGVSAVTKATAP